MAFTGENINLTKQRCRFAFARSPQVQSLGKTLFRVLNDFYGNPQTQFVAYSALVATDVVVCAGACTLYAIYYKKPAGSTTSAVLKIMDHASAVTQATPDYAIPLKNADEGLLVFAQGQTFASGITIQANTTSTGSTLPNAADRPSGFFIIGA